MYVAYLVCRCFQGCVSWCRQFTLKVMFSITNLCVSIYMCIFMCIYLYLIYNKIVYMIDKKQCMKQ